MFSRLIHITCITASFPFRVEWWSIPWRVYALRIHYSFDGTRVVPTLWLLWVVLLCTLAHENVLESPFSVLSGLFLGVELLSEVLILCFNFSRTCRRVVHKGCSHKEKTGFPVMPHHVQHSCFLFSFAVGFQVSRPCGVKGCPAVFICISLMTNDTPPFLPVGQRVGHLCVLFGELSVQLFPTSSWVFLLCSEHIYLFWVLNPYQVYDRKRLSPISWVMFILFTVLFGAQSF